MTSDTRIFRQILAWLRQDQPVYLFTVVSVEEHAPMPAGSMLAFNAQGDRIGTILRQELDETIIQQVIKGALTKLRLPVLMHLPSKQFPLGTASEESHVRLTVLVERIESVAQVQAILAALERGELVSRNVCLDTGESSLHPVRDNQRIHFDEQNVRYLYHPDELIFIVGSDEVSQILANLAIDLGYTVVICAPGKLRPESLHEQVRWTDSPVESAIRENVIHGYCSVVVLDTHMDLADDAVMTALDTPARYIGVLASGVSAKERNERLLENGIRTEAIQRIHSPVGLPIGSHTPEEIAVSILSGMIAHEHALQVSMVTSGQKRRVLFASRPVSVEIVRPTVERTRCSIQETPLGNPWKDCCPVDNPEDSLD